MTKDELRIARLEEQLRDEHDRTYRLTRELELMRTALRMSEDVRHQLVNDLMRADFRKAMA